MYRNLFYQLNPYFSCKFVFCLRGFALAKKIISVEKYLWNTTTNSFTSQ